MKNKTYVSVILIFVFTTLVTVYTKLRMDEKVKNSNNKKENVITLSEGWKKNSVTDKKITIFGNYYLSTDLDSDVSHNYYCQTNDCEFITGNDNYALIRDNGYLIFSLLNDGVYYLSDFSYDLDNVQFLVNNDTLYGLIYHEENKDFYYSLDTNEYYFLDDNIEIDYNSKFVIDKNELIVISDNGYSLVNYLTMKYLVNATTLEVDYYEAENDYLIIAYDYKDDIVNVYTSDLKSVNLPVIKNVSLYKNNIILTEDNKKFVVKNFNNETITISDEYDNIYDFINGHIIANKDNNLLIIDISDMILKEIKLDDMEYDHLRSGYNKELDCLILYIGKDLDWQEITFDPYTLAIYTKDV